MSAVNVQMTLVSLYDEKQRYCDSKDDDSGERVRSSWIADTLQQMRDEAADGSEGERASSFLTAALQELSFKQCRIPP